MHSTTPPLHHSITPSLHHSITPSLHHSITPSLHHSITPSLHHSITPSLHHSTTPPLHHSTPPLPLPMLNLIWLALLLSGVLVALLTGKLDAVGQGGLNAAKSAVMDLALPLVGVMALWLGLMRLAEKSGLIQRLGRLIRPIMLRLFPDVPSDHPAIGAMMMNISANMLGVSNAATPLGLKAMTELNRLNSKPGVATNAMCTFLAINTASIQLIPATAINLLAINGSKNPSAI